MNRQTNTQRIVFLLLIVFPLTISLINTTPQSNQESLRSLAVNNSITGEITALYIFSNHTDISADTYKTLFETSANIRITTINITDLMEDTSVADPFNVIIVGASAFDHWFNPNVTQSNIILNIGKPILSLGSGGNTFYEGLGYPYGGSSMGWSDGSGLYVNASDATHEVFTQTYSFDVPGNITFSRTFTYGLFLGNTYTNTEPLATDDDTYFSHAPFVQNTGFSRRMLQLGFLRAPTSQNDLYKLIHNCIEWLAGTPSEITVIIDDPLNNSVVESSSLEVNFSYTGEQAFIRAEVLINDESHLAGELYIGLTGLSGTGSIEVDIGSTYYLEDDWYKITVVVTDSLGWTGSSSIQVLRNEYPNPILSIQSPANNSVFYDDFYLVIEVHADYLAYLQYYFDGVYQGLLINDQASYYGNVNLLVNVSTLSTGYHYFDFLAVGHPNDIADIMFGFFVEEEPTTTTTPIDTTTTVPDTSTTVVTTTEDTTTESSETTTETPIDTTTEPTVSTPTLNITSGFSVLVIFFVLVILIPIKKGRKN